MSALSPGYIFARDDHSHVLGHHSEECGCGDCGGPIYVGDRAFYRELEGSWYCSHACVNASSDGYAQRRDRDQAAMLGTFG